MLHFYANPRDGAAGSGCNTCCCEATSARPGETNGFSINYAQWAVPLGGPGLTSQVQFEVEPRDGCAPGPSDASVSTPALFSTPVNTDLSGTLTGAVENPKAEALVFKLAQFGGASNGTVTVNPNGTFDYKPGAGFNGYDRFWWQVEVGGGNPIIGEAVIGVGAVAAPTAAANGTPMVSVVKSSVKVDPRTYTLTFALAVSPAARPGCFYRLSVRQQAISCEACFTHLSCFDVRIGKC